MLKANKEKIENKKPYLKSLSSVELMNEYFENYSKRFSCYADFLEWVTGKEILN